MLLLFANKTHLKNYICFEIIAFQICEILERAMWVMIRFQYVSLSVISIECVATA